MPGELSRVLSASFRRHYLTPPPPDFNRMECREVQCWSVKPAPTNDDTVIHGFGWNRLVALRSNSDDIRLNKGDAITFRGDFVHAPVGYDINNISAHCYPDTPFT
ncbi:hypothetical protein PHYPSEUDO_013186 [Phytophthora pseudosyringae]|uniref:Uncharacterized protein n=1 Tax=Phytophthora pseudosyringae TaxID=221518 RepID=A0A8T1W361_9STRA|nr:hypothetical protein PHYPSEUDO_013186 [Phytophthora pseudosyringae]